MQDIRSKIKHYFYRLQIFLNANPHIKRFFGLLTLVLFLPLTIGAVLTVQNIRQQASGSDYVKIVDVNGSVLTTTSDPNIFLQIILPSDWQLPTQSRTNSIIKQAYAQAACNATTTTCGQTTYDHCTFICNGNQATYYCYQTSNPNCSGTISCATEDNKCGQQPTPTPGCSPNSTICGQTAYDTCAPICTQDHRAAYSCYQRSNPNCTGIILCGTEDNRCATATTVPNIPTTTTQPGEPTVTPAPVVHILQTITIENKDTDGSSGGAQPITIPAKDALSLLTKPFPWILNPLASNQTQAQRTVQVTLFDGTNYIPFVATVTLTKNLPQTPSIAPTSAQVESNEFLVDVVIQHVVVNQEEVKNWIREAIDSKINIVYQQSGLKPRFRTNNIYIFDNKTCPPETTKKEESSAPGIIIPLRCESNRDGKIRVWISRPGVVSNANQDTATVEVSPYWLYPEYSKIKDDATALLIHEISHLFTLPDYYSEDVFPENNHVASIGITAFSKDWMWNHNDKKYRFFSEVSREYVNRVTSLPAGSRDSQGVFWSDKYTPGQIILKIMNGDSPGKNIKVEVFSQFAVGSGARNGQISDKSSNNGFTDNDGKFNLGDVYKIFDIDRSGVDLLRNGESAFLRITKGNEVKYMAITKSYLNYLYFHGQTDRAVITKKFSELDVDPSTTPGNQVYEEFRKCFQKDLSSNPSCKSQDKNGDGKVDEQDYKLFLQSLGQ